jgi:hypothetical protein
LSDQVLHIYHRVLWEARIYQAHTEESGMSTMNSVK